MSEAVAAAVDKPALRFERSDRARLKGITEPVSLFRVIVDRS